MLQEEDQKPPPITTRADEILKELGLYPKENAFHKTEEWVRMVDASNVDYLLCKFAETDEMSETERTFKVYANTTKCKIDMPIELIP